MVPASPSWSVGWPVPSGDYTRHIMRPENSWNLPGGAPCSMWGHPSLPHLVSRRIATPPLQLSSKSPGSQRCITKPQNWNGSLPSDSQQKKSRGPVLINWGGCSVGGGSKEWKLKKQNKRVEGNCQKRKHGIQLSLSLSPCAGYAMCDESASVKGTVGDYSEWLGNSTPTLPIKLFSLISVLLIPYPHYPCVTEGTDKSGPTLQELII